MDEEETDVWCLSDADSTDGMNQARFLFEEDLDEMIIPETPSPRRVAAAAVGGVASGSCRSKRRRLELPASNPSNRRPSSPGIALPSCSSSSSSSFSSTSSSFSSTSSSSTTSSFSMAGYHGEAVLAGLLGSGSPSEPLSHLPLGWGQLGPRLPSTTGSVLEGLLDDPGSWSPALPGRPAAARGSRKRGRTRTPRPPTPPAGSPAPGEASSLSFLTAEERRWVNGDVLPGSSGTGAGVLGEICMNNEEEAVVRTLQLEEDEAMARSLQDQFDLDDWRPQQHVDPREHLHGPYMDPRWTPAGSSLHGVMAALEDDLIGRHRRRGRGRAPGHRNRTATHLLEDLEGNNYEALLQFEEQQGSVVNRKLMSRQQIDRFPTKPFSTAPNAASAQCHICFCGYVEGDQLRMLSCFHDYHVGCIDRWLKDNATCPICRADMRES